MLRDDPRWQAAVPRTDASRGPERGVLAAVADLRCGGIVSLEGERTGRGTIAAALLAEATARGLAVALDDGGLHPPSLAAAGVDLERLLVVAVHTPLETARTTDIVLRAGTFGLVALPPMRLIPAVWRRIAMLARRSRTAVLAPAAGDGPLAEVATLRLSCTLERIHWLAGDGVWNRLAGYDVEVRLLGRTATVRTRTVLHARAQSTALIAVPSAPAIPRAPRRPARRQAERAG